MYKYIYIHIKYIHIYNHWNEVPMGFKWVPSRKPKQNQQKMTFRRRRCPSSKNWGFGVLFHHRNPEKNPEKSPFHVVKKCVFSVITAVFLWCFFNNNNDRPPSTRPQGQLFLVFYQGRWCHSGRLGGVILFWAGIGEQNNSSGQWNLGKL